MVNRILRHSLQFQDFVPPVPWDRDFSRLVYKSCHCIVLCDVSLFAKYEVRLLASSPL